MCVHTASNTNITGSTGGSLIKNKNKHLQY